METIAILFCLFILFVILTVIEGNLEEVLMKFFKSLESLFKWPIEIKFEGESWGTEQAIQVDSWAI